MTPKIAVQLLIGQNFEPFLPYAIRSVAWADYFTVCNTDPFGEIGLMNADVVKDEIPEWKLHYTTLQPDKDGHFSFAEARNKCLDMTALDDFVFIVDADDVHYPEWEHHVRDTVNTYTADSITAYFYHLMVYKNIYQYVQPREIIYKNYRGTHWRKGVHEQLVHKKDNPRTLSYHYMHYGYVKPQREVFSRWKFYSDLDGDFDHYNGQDPDQILSDRINVCERLPIDPPLLIQDFLRNYPDCPTGDLRSSPVRRGTTGEEKVGLVLLTVNDAELLDTALGTLAETTGPPEFTVLAIDCNSTDNSVEKLQEWQTKNVFQMEITGADSYVSLTEALNHGFDHFRTDETYKYVGWIHPDMEFVQAEWLHFLWMEFQEDQKLGKVSSANWRDPVPDRIIDGHEQCYIIRKDILHKIGLFDETYVGIGGYEDWDYNKRITQHQGPEGFYRVVISPRSWVLHQGMQTRNRRDTREEQVRNGQRYFEKWNTWQPPV